MSWKATKIKYPLKKRKKKKRKTPSRTLPRTLTTSERADKKQSSSVSRACDAHWLTRLWCYAAKAPSFWQTRACTLCTNSARTFKQSRRSVCSMNTWHVRKWGGTGRKWIGIVWLGGADGTWAKAASCGCQTMLEGCSLRTANHLTLGNLNQWREID